QRVFRVGDFVVFNDESADPANPGRRSYECAQITGPGAPGDVVPSGEFYLQRAYPGVPEGQATFGTLRCAHLAGIRFYKLDQKTFTFSVRKGFFRTPDLPARIEAKLPSACVVAALAGVANHFGYGPFTVFPLSRHNEPYMPGLRTCNGGAYIFQRPGPLAVEDTAAMPVRVQDSASIRSIYAYVQRGTSDPGAQLFTVKRRRAGGEAWEPLEYLAIWTWNPPLTSTYEGKAPPDERRLPYMDWGNVVLEPITGSAESQTLTVGWTIQDENAFLLQPDMWVHLGLGTPHEEYVRVLSVDPPSMQFTAVVQRDHPAQTMIHPTIWPTPVLNEGDDLSYDIYRVPTPDPGADLTVVIQT
ncbi:MAG: hypothetical protein ACP5OY_09620, partial [Halothiobacillaceae bacterium]